MGSLSICANENLLLLCENVLGDVALVPEAGVQRCDLHSDVLADSGRVDAAFDLEVDEDADLAARVDIGRRRCSCRSGAKRRICRFSPMDMTFSGRTSETFRSVPGYLQFHECLDVGGVVLQDDLADILDELNERSGLCAEVGLAVDLDDSADAALFADGSVCHTLGSDAAGLLGSLRQTLFAQPLDCLIHIAVGLGERLLAVHHTDVGHFTQFLDISSSKCHCYFLLIEIVSFDSEKAPVARRALFRLCNYSAAGAAASAAGASVFSSP